MAGREMIVKIVGVAEGWEKASRTAAAATDSTVRTQTSGQKKLEAAQRRLEDVIASSEQRIRAAKEKSEDAAGRVAVAEAKLGEEREKYGRSSSRALVAEQKLEKAKRDAAAATGQVTREVNMAQDAQKQLTKVTEDLADENDRASTMWGRLESAGERFKSAGPVEQLGLIAGAAAAAKFAVDLVGEAWTQAQEAVGSNAKLQSSMGLTDAQAEAAGKAAGELYAAGWGDSISDMSSATGSVMSSIAGMQDASATDLAAVTEQAVALAEVFDMDVSEAARNAGIWINEGLAADASEAFDLMAAGLQQVPEALRGEVMDAGHEYAQFFGQLGIDGSEAMAMLVSASSTGQYGIDKLGDSLKEFTIKATDLDDTTAQEALAALGHSGTDVANSLLAGGDDAREAMSQIVASLQSVEDPAEQARLAVALFGTPLEDMGKDELPAFLASLGAMDAGMGDVTGTASEIAEQMGATVDPIDQLKRALVTTISEALLPFVEPAQQLSAWAAENPQLVQGVAIGLGVLAVALGIAAVAQWAMNSAMLASPITWIILGIVALVAGFIWLWNNVEGFRNFWIGAWEVISGAAETAGQWIGEKLEDIKDAGARVGQFFAVDVPNFFTTAKDKVVEKITEMKDKGVAIFDGFVTGVGTVLDGIREAAAKPINFVIDFVWNDGLRAMVQGVLDLFGIDSISLPVVQPIALARGAMMGDGQRPILWNEVPGQREAYIPINQSARSRDLWMQTGRELGAIEMATGGIWPTQGAITSPFGYRVGPYNGAEHHDGIDIGAPGGTPVVAVLPGMVTFAGWNGGYGNQVTIDHGGGLSTFYAHLQSINAALGDMVEAGTLIGGVGTTGWSTGNHLHWGASLNGASIDPSGIVSGDISASGQPGGSSGPFGFISAIAGFIDKLSEIGESPWAKIAGGVVTGMLDHVGDWVKERLFSWLPTNDTPAQGGNFDGWWAEAIAVAGPGWDQYKDAVRAVAQHESGMNPNAVNDWDSNAIAGTPSKGLLQFVEPTFRQYAWPGHNNWLNPVDQILAFFNYVPARYGSIWNHPGLQGLAGGTAAG